jgi:hypothetical protein
MKIQAGNGMINLEERVLELMEDFVKRLLALPYFAKKSDLLSLCSTHALNVVSLSLPRGAAFSPSFPSFPFSFYIYRVQQQQQQQQHQQQSP